MKKNPFFLLDMRDDDGHIGPLFYNDLEPLHNLDIPPILTGQEPAFRHEIYTEFRLWIEGLENIDVHLRDTYNMFQEYLNVSQLRALRFAVMSQLFMRHPRAERAARC